MSVSSTQFTTVLSTQQQIIIPKSYDNKYIKPGNTEYYLNLDKTTIKDSLIVYYTEDCKLSSTSDMTIKDELIAEYVDKIEDIYTNIHNCITNKDPDIYIIKEHIHKLYTIYFSYPPSLLDRVNYEDMEKDIYKTCIELSEKEGIYDIVKYLLNDTDMIVHDNPFEIILNTTEDHDMFELFLDTSDCDEYITQDLILSIINNNLPEIFETTVYYIQNSMDIPFDEFLESKYIHEIFDTLPLEIYIILEQLEYDNNNINNTPEYLIKAIDHNREDIYKYIIHSYSNSDDPQQKIENFIDHVYKIKNMKYVDTFYNLLEDKELYHMCILSYKKFVEYHIRYRDLHDTKNHECISIQRYIEEIFEHIELHTMRDTIRMFKTLDIPYKNFIYFIPTFEQKYIIEFYGVRSIDFLEGLHINTGFTLDNEYIDYLLDKFTFDDRKNLIETLGLPDDRISVVEECVFGGKYVVCREVLKLIAEYR